jgi:lipoprotein signal peptidase
MSRAVAAGLVLVPLLDQAIKLLIRRRLGRGTISLGALGEVRMVQADIWIARASRRLSPAAMWILWILAAATVAISGARLPWSGWFSGLLLGGSLSHAVETSLRGAVCDYVRLRFWPAFNLADVALAVAACGMLVELVVAIGAAHP